MEENQIDEKQEKVPSKGNSMIWIAVVAVVVIVGIVYFSRGGNRATSPASAPADTSSVSETAKDSSQNNAPISATAVTIQNFAFSPASLTIKKGESVTWTNEDSAPHQIASDSNAFSGNAISKGQTYSFTFNDAGEFDYHCAIHPSMKGKIIVQ